MCKLYGWDNLKSSGLGLEYTLYIMGNYCLEKTFLSDKLVHGQRARELMIFSSYSMLLVGPRLKQISIYKGTMPRCSNISRANHESFPYDSFNVGYLCSVDEGVMSQAPPENAILQLASLVSPSVFIIRSSRPSQHGSETTANIISFAKKNSLFRNHDLILSSHAPSGGDESSSAQEVDIGNVEYNADLPTHTYFLATSLDIMSNPMHKDNNQFSSQRTTRSTTDTDTLQAKTSYNQRGLPQKHWESRSVALTNFKPCRFCSFAALCVKITDPACILQF